MDIDDPASLIVSKNLVGLDKKPDPVLSPFTSLGILVGVRVQDQPPVGATNLSSCRGLADPEDRVVVELLSEFFSVGVVHSAAPSGTGECRAIEEDGDRTIVIEPNIHMGSENTLPNHDTA